MEDQLTGGSYRRAIGRSLALAWWRSKIWLIILTVAMLISAVLPAVQVYLGSELTGVLTKSGAKDPRVLWLVAWIAISVGLLLSLFEILWSLRDALETSVGGTARICVNNAMAKLAPEQLADADVTAQARAAREAAKTSVAGIPAQFILSFRAIIAAATVVAVLWATSVVW